jgi:hypothetical protein
MTFYYPSWAALKGNATEVEQDDEENSLTRKTTPGPKKGFTDTAGKTVAKYNEYVYLMGESRKGPNAKLWSDRLKLATLKNLDPKKIQLEQDIRQWLLLRCRQWIGCNTLNSTFVLWTTMTTAFLD